MNKNKSKKELIDFIEQIMLEEKQEWELLNLGVDYIPSITKVTINKEL